MILSSPPDRHGQFAKFAGNSYVGHLRLTLLGVSSRRTYSFKCPTGGPEQQTQALLERGLKRDHIELYTC